jgi:hypothetical protein
MRGEHNPLPHFLRPTDVPLFFQFKMLKVTHMHGPACFVLWPQLERNTPSRRPFRSVNANIMFAHISAYVFYISVFPNVNCVIQDDHKVSVHLMITIQKVTSNVQSVPRQSVDIY